MALNGIIWNEIKNNLSFCNASSCQIWTSFELKKWIKGIKFWRILKNFESQTFRTQFQTRSDSDELSLDQDWDPHSFQKTWRDALNDLQVRVSRTIYKSFIQPVRKSVFLAYETPDINDIIDWNIKTLSLIICSCKKQINVITRHLSFCSHGLCHYFELVMGQYHSQSVDFTQNNKMYDNLQTGGLSYKIIYVEHIRYNLYRIRVRYENRTLNFIGRDVWEIHRKALIISHEIILLRIQIINEAYI